RRQQADELGHFIRPQGSAQDRLVVFHEPFAVGVIGRLLIFQNELSRLPKFLCVGDAGLGSVFAEQPARDRQSEQFGRRVGGRSALLAVALHLGRHASEGIETQQSTLLQGAIPSLSGLRRQAVIEPNLFQNGGGSLLEEFFFSLLFDLPRQLLQPALPL